MVLNILTTKQILNILKLEQWLLKGDFLKPGIYGIGQIHLSRLNSCGFGNFFPPD